jgi:hypothetical protein
VRLIAAARIVRRQASKLDIATLQRAFDSA